jgi:hypothetical protein
MTVARRTGALALCLSALGAGPAATQPAGPLPHITIDAKARTVRVDCEAVAADYPLEFLAVVTGTNEYEAVVRSEVKPSDLHLALLMVGLKPGQPVRYSEATKSWLPPEGPPVDIWFEYEKDGKSQRVPAYRWMRDVHTKAAAQPFTWVFTGSRTIEGVYAADQTGSLVGVINNENSVLDVPALRSRALEARDYERNSDLLPPTGTPVTMVLSPAAADAPGTRPAATEPAPPARVDTAPGDSPGLSDVHIDQPRVDRLRAHWDARVAPHREALREAAEAHYEVINDLRHEQQRLIDEADRIQRTIDELEKAYADMTTPQPESTTQP